MHAHPKPETYQSAIDLDFAPVRFKSREKEHLFRQHHLAEDQKKVAVILLMAIGFVLFFMAMEALSLSDSIELGSLLVTRSAFVLTFIAILFFLKHIRHEKLFDGLVFTSALAVSAMQIVIHFQMPAGYGSPILFNIMIILFLYIILPTCFIILIIPALLLSFDIIVFLVPGTPADRVFIWLALLCAHLIGIVFSWQTHKNRRIQFDMWQTEIELKDRLEAKRDTLNAILSASPIAICLVENRVIKWANGAFMKMFAFQREEEFVNQSVMICYETEDEFHRAGHVIYEKLASGKTAEEDVLLKRRNGENFTGHVKASCHDPSRPFDRTVVTISDISWRKVAESDRLNQEKMYSVIETAGAVCHELNQPLQAISGYTELLLMDLAEDHPFYPKIQTIREQVGRIGEITQKLMRITRYETMEYLKGKIIDIDKSTEKTGSA